MNAQVVMGGDTVRVSQDKDSWLTRSDSRIKRRKKYNSPTNRQETLNRQVLPYQIQPQASAASGEPPCGSISITEIVCAAYNQVCKINTAQTSTISELQRQNTELISEKKALEKANLRLREGLVCRPSKCVKIAAVASILFTLACATVGMISGYGLKIRFELYKT